MGKINSKTICVKLVSEHHCITKVMLSVENNDLIATEYCVECGKEIKKLRLKGEEYEKK